jgi:hypothetical protein
MKMDLGKVMEAFNELKRIEDLPASAEFSYAAMKNYKLCEAEAETIQNFASKAIEGGEVYLLERTKIASKYAKKDQNDVPMTEALPNGMQRYIFDSDEMQQKFVEETLELDKKHSEYINKVKKRQTELEKLLKKEIEVDFLKVPFETFPNQITPRQLRILEFMIREDKNDK